MLNPMDSFRVHVVACAPETLELAVALAMDGGTVQAWTVLESKDDGGEWLALHWATPQKSATAFPVPLGATVVLTLVSKWLEGRKPHAAAPDLDGSVSRGFELVAEKDGWSYEQFRIRPIWAEHHK